MNESQEQDRLKAITEALQLDAMSAEERVDTLAEVHDLIFRSAMLKLIKSMTEEQKEEFGKLIDTDAEPEKIEAFLSGIPGAEEAVDEATTEVTDAILSSTEDSPQE